MMHVDKTPKVPRSTGSGFHVAGWFVDALPKILSIIEGAAGLLLLFVARYLAEFVGPGGDKPGGHADMQTDIKRGSKPCSCITAQFGPQVNPGLFGQRGLPRPGWDELRMIGLSKILRCDCCATQRRALRVPFFDVTVKFLDVVAKRIPT
jgi:hypothetical protein